MIYLGNDHAGEELKEIIKEHLRKNNIEFIDCVKNNTPDDDYPDSAHNVCKNIVNESDIGILICGTGIGMSIAANKVKGIRAALCTSMMMAEFSRLHNNANCLCLGSRLGIDKIELLNMVDKFLTTKFEGGRHLKRIEKIENNENA